MPDVLGDKKLPPVMQERQEGRRYLVEEDLPGDKNTRQEEAGSSWEEGPGISEALRVREIPPVGRNQGFWMSWEIRSFLLASKKLGGEKVPCGERPPRG